MFLRIYYLSTSTFHDNLRYFQDSYICFSWFITYRLHFLVYTFEKMVFDAAYVDSHHEARTFPRLLYCPRVFLLRHLLRCTWRKKSGLRHLAMALLALYSLWKIQKIINTILVRYRALPQFICKCVRRI